MKKQNLLGFALILACILTLSSCGARKDIPTRGSLYGAMYEAKPRSIVVMPPINETTHVDAKEYFYTTIATPLIEQGYYVFSPILAKELLQQEGAEHAEEFLTAPLAPFQQVFGADAVLFTRILAWERQTVGNYIRAKIEYILRDARSGGELFRRSADISVDTRVAKGFGLLDVVANAVANVATNKTTAARKANAYILQDMPLGYYAPNYGKDKETPVGPQDVKGATVK